MSEEMRNFLKDYASKKCATDFIYALSDARKKILHGESTYLTRLNNVLKPHREVLNATERIARLHPDTDRPHEQDVKEGFEVLRKASDYPSALLPDMNPILNNPSDKNICSALNITREHLVKMLGINGFTHSDILGRLEKLVKATDEIH